MPWTRDEPDPLKARRRQLEEQERKLAERMSRLNDELRNGGKPTPARERKAPEPPVWRMEDDVPRQYVSDPASPRKRNLGRQRQRDMVIFFICIVLLLVAMLIFLWLWQTHVPSTSG